jgi:hypothetical protein
VYKEAVGACPFVLPSDSFGGTEKNIKDFGYEKSIRPEFEPGQPWNRYYVNQFAWYSKSMFLGMFTKHLTPRKLAVVWLPFCGTRKCITTLTRTSQ